jgi:hypothetical protein
MSALTTHSHQFIKEIKGKETTKEPTQVKKAKQKQKNPIT